MITLITYLTWPRFTGVYELTLENLIKIGNSIKGPDLFIPVCLDWVITMILVGIIIYRQMKKSESSSKTEP